MDLLFDDTIDTTSITNVLLIDRDTPGYSTFYNSCNQNTFPIVYSRSCNRNDLLQLLTNKFTKIDRLGLVFNLEQVYVFLDNQPLFKNTERVPYSENVIFIINLIKQFNISNIDYLACNTLKYDKWRNYYSIISSNTTATVGASIDQTGNIKYGGNWIMESTGQDIELIYFNDNIENYQTLLDMGHYSVIIMNDGSIYGTGANESGQLGLGDDYDDRTTITQMINTTGKKAVSLSTGLKHTVVIMDDGSIYGTGFNGLGQLGLGHNTIYINTLTLMNNDTGKTPKAVSCGLYFTIILMTDGSIYGTGHNNGGQLGLGDAEITSTNTLTLMTNDTGKTPVAVSCGDQHTIVLMSDGSIYGTGSDGSGQLGLGDTNFTSRNTLTLMINYTESTPISISCGSTYTIVLMSDGSIYGTGINTDGQLGVDNYFSVNILTEMVNNSGKIPKAVFCGTRHTIVLMTDGSIYGTGHNNGGQLGLNNTNNREGLTQMINNTGKTPIDIYCGHGHTIVFMRDGSIYGTGGNGDGQLGLGDKINRKVLTQMINNTNLYPNKLGIFILSPVGNICFPAGTPILTNQGLIPIEKINPSIHTIRNKPIIGITKSVYASDKYLVCFEKDCLGNNIPSQKTIISKNHKIFYNGKMVKAFELVGLNDKIRKLKYKGEILYNVLMEVHDKMIVNNLICETLDPTSDVAKIYKCCQFLNIEEQNKLIELYNTDYRNHYNILRHKL